MKKLLTPREVATLLDVSVKTVSRLRDEGLISSMKIGRGVRFDEDQLKAELLKMRESRNCRTRWGSSPIA